jgi:hypothetical protein
MPAEKDLTTYTMCKFLERGRNGAVVRVNPFMICLVPVCPRKARRRGVCYPHYLTFANMVYQGELTWDDLADLGYVHRPSSR